MTDNPSQIMEPIESFVCEYDGERMWFYEHETHVAAAHPIVAMHPNRFRPVEDRLTFTDEMATDNPGERRNRAIPRRERAAVPAKEK